VRLAKILATGLYLLALAAGSLTLGGGCGGGAGDGEQVLVPAKTDPPSEEERKGRMEAMKRAQEAQRKSR